MGKRRKMDPLEPVYEGSHCTACGFTNFPTSELCPSCLAQPVEVRELSRTGQLYSFSSLRTNEGVQFVGYIDLPEKVRVFGRIDSASSDERPVCGMPVRLQVVQKAEAAPSFVFVRDDRERAND